MKVADDMGLDISSLVNGYLHHLVRRKYVEFSLDEKPTPYLEKILKESKNDVEKGWISPGFTNAKDAISWLENPSKKYARQIQ